MINNFSLAVSGGRNRFRIMSPYPLFPEARRLEDRFDQIKAEVDKLVARRNLPQYGDIDPIRAAAVSEGWRLYCVSRKDARSDRRMVGLMV